MLRPWHPCLLLALTGCAQVLGLSDYKEAGGGGATGSSVSGQTSASTAQQGGGGSGPQVCQTDAECSNGLFCDGAEHCGDDGFCSPGVPACPPPSDTAHCQVPCSESASAAVCAPVAAIDADADGHGNLLCAAAPGDDCDDADPTRFPGNAEICDAIDNDCNSMVDEGLPASGGSVEIGGSDSLANAHVAYSAGLATYATAYVQSVEVPDIEMVFTGHDGVSTGQMQIGEFVNQGEEEVRPRVAATDLEFAVTWHDEDDVEGGIYAAMADTSELIHPAFKVSTTTLGGITPDIVDTPDKDFIVVFTASNAPGDDLLAQRVAKNGLLVGGPVTISNGVPAATPKIARNGDHYAVVWRSVETGNPVVKARAFDDGFVLQPAVTLGNAGVFKGVAVAPSGTGFSIAYHGPAGALSLSQVNTALAVQAENHDETGSGELSLLTSGSEVLLLESPANATPDPIAKIYRFDASAGSLFSPLQVSESNLIDTDAGLATLVSSPAGVAVVWDNVNASLDTVERVMFRGMGNLLCN